METCRCSAQWLQTHSNTTDNHEPNCLEIRRLTVALTRAENALRDVREVGGVGTAAQIVKRYFESGATSHSVTNDPVVQREQRELHQWERTMDEHLSTLCHK